MKFLIVLMFSALVITSTAFAAGKEYQVTGPVVETSADSISVQKGKDVWEIKRGSDTKAPTNIAKGDKVTVHYTMAATDIEVKPAGKSAKKK
jgi:hypothetical protein